MSNFIIKILLCIEFVEDVFGKEVEKAKIHHDARSIPQRKDDDIKSALTNIGLDKNDIKDVLDYISYLKFKKDKTLTESRSK